MAIVKKKAAVKGKSKPAAVSGAKGPNYKPKFFGNGGAGGDEKFPYFEIPVGAPSTEVVFLEDVYTWFVVHRYKRPGDKFFGNRCMFQAPIDPDNPETPTFVDQWIAKNPTKRGKLVERASTIAVARVWVPNGVPKDAAANEFYQVNGTKILVVPQRQVMPLLNEEYNEARKKGKDLRGLKFFASRSEADKVPRAGDVWRVKGRYKLEFIERKLGLKQTKWPFDYNKLIPKVDKKAFLKLMTEAASGGSVSTTEDEEEGGDDIPF